MRVNLFILLTFLFFSCRKKAPLFILKHQSETGVDFVNKVSSTTTLNAFNFTNFYNGGGVGIADFNLDGIPDLCFTSNQHTPEIFTGKGNLKFEKVTDSGLKNPGWATGISIADINQDGWPDIYISMANHPSIPFSKNQLYINRKTEIPSFSEEAELYGLDYEGFTNQAAFFDYDNDGDLDVFLLNTAPDYSNPNNLTISINDGSSPSSDKLFINNGKGNDGRYHYSDNSQDAGIIYEGLGLGVSLGDFNSDGFTDIYCSNDFQSDDVFYQNNGNGTFTNIVKKAMKHTSLYGMGIDAADINNDNLTDIFQLDMLPEDSDRQKQMIAKGDYDKKKLSTSRYNYNLQYMRNMLQINMGQLDDTTYFSEQGFLYDIAATDWSWSVLLADFDLDGWKDAFIANGYRKNVTDLDFVSYNKNYNIFGSKEARQKNTEELLKAVPEIKLRNYAFRNNQGSGFTNISDEWGLDQLSYSNGAAFADLDLDGDLDLVVNNIDEPAFVFENQSAAKNSIQISFEGDNGNLDGIGASVECHSNGTTQLLQNYPIRGYLSSMNTGLIIGLGESKKADKIMVHWPDGREQIIENIPAGSKLTLKATEATQTKKRTSTEDHLQFRELKDIIAYNHQESAFVDFNQTPTLQRMISRNGPPVEKADFNKDGLEDVVIGGSYQGSPTVVFLQQKDGSFYPKDTLNTSDLEVGAFAILDFNGDGVKDILVTPTVTERPPSVNNTYRPRLFQNTGNGTFEDQSSLLPVLNITSQAVAVFDANNDRKPDLFISGYYIPGQFPHAYDNKLLLWENGRFINSPLPENPATIAIKDVEALDLDSDGDMDLLAAGHWGSISAFYNTGKGSLEQKETNLPTGWWNVIKATDIDQDGDMDLILGNEGLNSIFKASQKEPVTLLAKDFNADGTIDPIWCTFLKDKEVAIHPLGTLTQQVVQFRKKFRLFKDYALADISDLFTHGDLEGATILKVTELRSGLGINNGDGTFTFRPLPFEVQQSPVNDILPNDFDKDGKTDLLMAGNFYPNEPIFGQCDASFGVFLTGQNQGNFVVKKNSFVNLKLDGDIRYMIPLNPQRILVTSNGNPVKMIEFGNFLNR